MCHHCHSYLDLDATEILYHCRTCLEMPRVNNKYRHVCFRCDYHVHNAWQMKNHIRRHLGEKPYECVYCDYRATKKNLLKYHYKLKHGGEPGDSDQNLDSKKVEEVYVIVKWYSGKCYLLLTTNIIMDARWQETSLASYSTRRDKPQITPRE